MVDAVVVWGGDCNADRLEQKGKKSVDLVWP
jgi:hypothetical protein